MDIRRLVIDKTNRIWKNREKIYAVLIFCGVILTAVLMYVRAFYGTELTDEAYYVSEAKEMLNGNIPFAYNNSSKALGFTFLLIAVEWAYGLFVPDLSGVFLFTRLCFVTCKVIACLAIFRVLGKKRKKSHALLLVGMLLPMNGYMQNFSYNTIPAYTLFVAGCLLYDAVELDAPHKKAELIAAGLLTGIAGFANPGWLAALIIFCILILLRMPGKKEKMGCLFFFGAAVLAEVLIVTALISIQAGFAEFCYGFYRLFINQIPVDPLNPDKNWAAVFGSFREPLLQWARIFVPVSACTFVFSVKHTSEDGEKLSGRQRLTLSISAAMFFHLMYLSYQNRGSEGLPYMWAFAAFCHMAVFLLAGAYKEEKIICYLGLYPPAYVAAAIIMLSAGADVGRFAHAFTILVPMLYVLLGNRLKLVRAAAAILSAVLIVSLIYIDFRYVYRDADFRSLGHRVESGVYKGLYTTEARAKDLPELEEYLNGMIGEDETYAFRDNVPGAYLMVHKGTMCEMSTWDILQYSYKRNSPAVMFDYYRRRGMIPDKIIYVDFGRDAGLSIADPGFRYNDWVSQYYDLAEDIKLNETYFHVMVYQYNGTFDGNYQYWIDTYWDLAK